MSKIAIIIFSCFKYRYLWNIAINSWQKELADEFYNFDFYITTDNPSNINLNNYLNNKNVQLIIYPNKITWTESTYYSLNTLYINKYKNIITSFDDLILTKIDKKLLFRIINNNYHTNYFRLINNHSNFFQRMFFYKEFNIDNPLKYLGSMVMTLWNLEFLINFFNNHKKELLKLNAWEYEKAVPKLIGKYQKMKYSNQNIIVYQNLMLKGKIDLFSLYYLVYLKKEDMKEVYNNYPKLNFFKNSAIYFYYFIFNISQIILPNYLFKKISKLKDFFLDLR